MSHASNAPSTQSPSGFLALIEPSLNKRLLGWLISYPLTVAGVVFGLSAFIGKSEIIIIASVLAAVWYVTVTIIVAAYGYKWHKTTQSSAGNIARLREQRNRFAKQLADIQRENVAYYETLSWKEEMRIVDSTGTTEIRRRVRVKAGVAGVDVLFAATNSNEIPKNRNSITAGASRITESGGKVELPYQTNWEEEHKHCIFVFFGRKYQPDEEVEVEFFWNWPEYSLPLMAGKDEPMIHTPRRRIKKFEYSLFVPRVGAFTDANISVEKINSDGPEVIHCDTSPKGIAIKMTAENVRPGRSIGFHASSEFPSTD